MNGWEILLGLVKAVAWPATVFFIVLQFRDEFKGLIPNTLKAGPTGFEFRAASQTVRSITSPGDLRNLPGITRTPAMNVLEVSLHQALAAIKEDERTDLLISQLAQSRIETHMERVYRTIFQSQIAGLQALRDGGGTAERSRAEGFFNDVKERMPEFYADAAFEAWIGYLINQYLVSAGDGKVSITELGREFLNYLEKFNLPANRIG